MKNPESVLKQYSWGLTTNFEIMQEKPVLWRFKNRNSQEETKMQILEVSVNSASSEKNMFKLKVNIGLATTSLVWMRHYGLMNFVEHRILFV